LIDLFIFLIDLFIVLVESWICLLFGYLVDVSVSGEKAALNICIKQ